MILTELYMLVVVISAMTYELSFPWSTGPLATSVANLLIQNKIPLGNKRIGTFTDYQWLLACVYTIIITTILKMAYVIAKHIYFWHCLPLWTLLIKWVRTTRYGVKKESVVVNTDVHWHSPMFYDVKLADVRGAMRMYVAVTINGEEHRVIYPINLAASVVAAQQEQVQPKQGLEISQPGSARYPGLKHPKGCGLLHASPSGSSLFNQVYGVFSRVTYGNGTVLLTATHLIKALIQSERPIYLRYDGTDYLLDMDSTKTMLFSEVSDLDVTALQIPDSVWSVMAMRALKLAKPCSVSGKTITIHSPAMESESGWTKSYGSVTRTESLFRVRHKASTSPGTSGSPVFLANGRVVGVHTGYHQDDNLATIVVNLMKPSNQGTESTPGQMDWYEDSPHDDYYAEQRAREEEGWSEEERYQAFDPYAEEYEQYNDWDDPEYEPTEHALQERYGVNFERMQVYAEGGNWRTYLSDGKSFMNRQSNPATLEEMGYGPEVDLTQKFTLISTDSDGYEMTRIRPSDTEGPTFGDDLQGPRAEQEGNQRWFNFFRPRRRSMPILVTPDSDSDTSDAMSDSSSSSDVHVVINPFIAEVPQSDEDKYDDPPPPPPVLRRQNAVCHESSTGAPVDPLLALLTQLTKDVAEMKDMTTSNQKAIQAFRKGGAPKQSQPQLESSNRSLTSRTTAGKPEAKSAIQQPKLEAAVSSSQVGRNKKKKKQPPQKRAKSKDLTTGFPLNKGSKTSEIHSKDRQPEDKKARRRRKRRSRRKQMNSSKCTPKPAVRED